MEKDYVPYFVVYRYRVKQDGGYFCEGFVTLRQLYAFIGNHIESWSEYHVGRNLESYSL